MRGLSVALAAGAVIGLAGVASAGPIYGFTAITANGAASAASAGQFFVEVNDEGSNQVSFQFTNGWNSLQGPVTNITSFIDSVYFDDGSLLGIASVVNGPGVNFSQGASPPNLPGGNNASPNFVTTAGFLADATNPGPQNGVNNFDATSPVMEFVTIIFDLQSGRDYQDVLDDLATGELRIGIHSQGFDNGQSESFINGGIIPLPATAGLAVLGLGLVGGIRRRRLA